MRQSIDTLRLPQKAAMERTTSLDGQGIVFNGKHPESGESNIEVQ
jgi:hypothetical protein